MRLPTHHHRHPRALNLSTPFILNLSTPFILSLSTPFILSLSKGAPENSSIHRKG